MLGIYNLSLRKFIGGGSLTNQARKDYFYGKDGKAEKALGYVEGIASGVIRNILTSHKLPVKGSMENQMLILFIIILHARTEYAEEAFNEGIDKFFKASLMRFYEKKEDIRIRLENAVQGSVKFAALMSPVTFDLSFKVLVNKTAVEFITSDNPSILYNQYLEARNPLFNNIGFVAKGLEIFFPLSPKLCLFFYDFNVYGVGEKDSELIEVTDINDVDSINGLQFTSANKNIYFNENVREDYVVKLEKRFLKYKRAIKAETREFKNHEDPNKLLVEARHIEVRCELRLTFVRILRKAQRFKVDSSRALIPRSDEVLEKAYMLEKFWNTTAKKI